jgi:hypothetical protein
MVRVHRGPLLVLTRLLAMRLATTLTRCTGRPRPLRGSRPGFLLEPQRSAWTSAADSRVLAATPFNAAGVALIEDAELAPYLPRTALESVMSFA